MSFKEKLYSGKFAVMAELQPPKGIDLSAAHECTARWKGRLDAVNVPDLQGAVMRLGSLPVCALLKEKGMEAIYNLSCGHRNRLALQSELLNASAFGLKNLLLLQGDPPSLGDHFEARPVFDLDVTGLLGAAKRLQEGYDLMGNEVAGKPVFFTGTEVNAALRGQALEIELANMEKKIALGTGFFVTGSIYDPGLLENFIKRAAHFNVPVIASIPLLKSAGMARYINKHVEGASIPEALIDRLLKASDKQKVSMEIAGDLIAEVKPLCQGIQIIPIGWEHLVIPLLDLAGF